MAQKIKINRRNSVFTEIPEGARPHNVIKAVEESLGEGAVECLQPLGQFRVIANYSGMKKLCVRCKQVGHFTAGCTCKMCGEVGHSPEECLSQMKKKKLSGAQNRKKRAREEESRQRGTLNDWIKRSKEEVEDNDLCKKDGDFSTFFERNDFGYLKKPVSNKLKITIVQHGPERYQNKSGPFIEKNGRSFSKQWFEKVSTNGETVKRKCLLYSPYRKACYCFVCFLFAKEQSSSMSNFSKEEGFSSWRKLNPQIPDHEKSPSHKSYIREYLNLVVRLQCSNTTDAELQQQMSAVKKKWKAITERIVEVTSFLAFRGHRGEGISRLTESEEIINENAGNFMATIRLLAKYDVNLAEHMQRGKEKPKSVTYLSTRSQNEIIDLLDTAHEDQVSEILRYVHIDENNKVEMKEIFLGFFQINKKDAVSLANMIMKKLEENKISIKDCRGQVYDNAAVMAGGKGSVQQKILQFNPKAVFVNFENHSLNLACVHASEVQPVVVTFF
ncbi:zinc finger MYM-type protein 1-like [Limulus polyphemus]|uniref:Zinc finger MYM-type protein 1-like n=1 Tax=Limulus polyphemus TaxID=6850 RepID=A0ABM1C0E2_LIMPO|nr:zinc finger MYM-type protein 1-like [Limulus polyphemus]